jgi:hypothetical protein
MSGSTVTGKSEMSKAMLGYSGGLASITLGKAVADSLAGALLQVPTPLKESLAKKLSDAALGSLGGQAKAQIGIFDSPTFARAIAPTFEFGELVPEFQRTHHFDPAANKSP